WNQKCCAHRLAFDLTGLQRGVQGEARQFLLIFERLHHGVGAEDVQSPFAKMVGVGMVFEIDDQHIEEILISLGHARDGAGPTLALHQSARGTGDGIAAYDWADCRHRSRGATKRLPHSWNSENRSDAGDGIAWREYYRLRRLDAFNHVRSGMRALRAFEAHRAHFDLVALAHEGLLKVQRALGSLE